MMMHIFLMSLCIIGGKWCGWLTGNILRNSQYLQTSLIPVRPVTDIVSDVIGQFTIGGH